MLNTKRETFQLHVKYHGEYKLHFDEMVMMYALNKTNKLYLDCYILLGDRTTVGHITIIRAN